MAQAAHQHKDMPDGVKVPHLFDGVKDDADRIENAAGDQQPQAEGVHFFEQRTDGDHNDPAHGDVADHGGLAELFKIDGVEHDTHHGSAPNHAEQRPAERTAQNGEGDRRVGAGDQKEDGVVIHHAKKPLCLGMRDRVVEGAHAVENDHARAENRHAHHRQRVAEHRRRDDQHDRAADRQQCADAVRDRAEDLLAERISLLLHAALLSSYGFATSITHFCAENKMVSQQVSMQPHILELFQITP